MIDRDVLLALNHGTIESALAASENALAKRRTAESQELERRIADLEHARDALLEGATSDRRNLAVQRTLIDSLDLRALIFGAAIVAQGVLDVILFWGHHGR